MFDKVFIKKLKGTAIFIVIYTVIFVLFFSTISYTIPFVLAIIIAFLTKPVTNFFRQRLKLSRGISSLISTILVFLVIFFLLTMIIFKITVEAKQLLAAMPDLNTSIKFFDGYISRIKEYYTHIDPSIIDKINSQMSSIVSGSLNITVRVMNKLVSFAIGLPLILMIVFFTMLATYFFSKDMPSMRNKLVSVFSPKGQTDLAAIWSEAIRMIGGYFKAFSLVISLTFIETLIGFSILGIKYALLLSIICAIFDVLPILGIGTIYLPLALIYFISKNYVVAVALIVLYAVVSIIRQIVEPKLYSVSLGLHPVAVLAAIFIGLQAYGLLGMIYLIFLMVLYNILKKVNVL